MKKKRKTRNKDKYSYIGERIRKSMQRQGVTYEELAKRAGVAKRTIENSINFPGNRRLRTLDQIAEVLGLSLEELIRKKGL